MKIIMIYDQIQAGVGTKDDTMVPIAGNKAAVGPAVMMEPLLKEVDGHIIACLYCGTDFYNDDIETNNKKFCAMAQKLGADIVICGPCFNFKEYAPMALRIAQAFNTKTNIPAISAMSEDMSEIMEPYIDSVPIVKMPKKGGTGLNVALRNILRTAKQIVEKGDIDAIKEQNCYK